MAPTDTASSKAALVTGAAQGIGAAIALGLARDGYDVAVTSRSVDKLSETVRQIASAGVRAISVALDMGDHASIENAIQTTAEDFGRIDVLVNNAGTTLRKSALDTSPSDWDHVIGTNLTGTFLVTQAMGRHLIATQRSGVIINIASTHGLLGFAGRCAYGVSKAGVMHMTRMLAIEWVDHGIRVNAVVPGTVLTPSRQTLAMPSGYREAMRNRIPMKRECTLEEVAGAVCYLASPQAAYMTGQTLVLDGGLTVQ